MKKLNEFSDLLAKNGLDKNVYFEVRDVLDVYIWGTYDYLSISAEQWESVTCDIIDDIFKKEVNMITFMGELRKKLNIVIRSFLIKKIKKQEPLVFDNLIIKLRNKKLNNEAIINSLLRELELLNISFDEEIYMFLIKKSYEFRRLISTLNLGDYSYESFLIYFNKVTNETKDEKKSKKTTSYALKKESQELELRKSPIKAKGLYERFSDCEYITDSEKKLIVDYFIGLLPPEKQEYVNLCCKGLLYENDSKIANIIIGNVKAHYQRFLNSGHLPTDNEVLKQLYQTILERRNDSSLDFVKDDKEDCLSLLDLNLSGRARILFKQQLRLLEVKYVEKGYTKKDFYQKIIKFIELMKEYPIVSEDDYIKVLLDMLYSEINIEIIRA